MKPRSAAQRENGMSKREFDKTVAEVMNDPDETPLEKLRFYCSLVMSGTDWLNSEPFFVAIEKQLRRLARTKERT